MSNVLKIAGIEFSGIVKEPLVVFIACLLFALSILNGMGGAHLIPVYDMNLMDGNDHFFSVGMSNVMGTILQYMLIVSTFIGILSLYEERSKGSLRVLITKPLYRRDVIIGKFLGLATFLLLLVVVEVLVSMASIIVYYHHGPASTQDAIQRPASYMGTLFLICLINLSLTLLIGAIFKDMLKSLMITGSLMFLEWYHYSPQQLGDLQIINPQQLFIHIIGTTPTYLFETSCDFGRWLSGATPYVVVGIIEILAVLLISTFIFSREET